MDPAEGDHAFWHEYLQVQQGRVAPPMGPTDRERVFWNGHQWVHPRASPAAVPMGSMGHESIWNGHQWVPRRVSPTTVPMGSMDSFWNGHQRFYPRASPATVPMGFMDHEPAFWSGDQRDPRRVSTPATASNIGISVSRGLYSTSTIA